MAATNLVRSPIGGMIGGFEDFENERGSSSQPNNNNQSNNSNTNPLMNAFLSAPADFISPVSTMATDLAKDSADSIIDLGKTILGIGEKPQEKFSSKGSLDNFQNPTPEQNQKNQEAQIKRVFYSSLEESSRNARSFNSEKAMQDAVRMEVAAMSVTDKLDNLHMSLDLDEKHISDPYHINELRRKKLEQLKKAKAEQQSQEMAGTSKSSLLMNQNAQEGQSMTSSSGAIVSAG